LNGSVRATVVDASVWVSRFVPVDANHAASRAWFGAHLSAGGILVAPTLLLAEVAGAISRRTGDAVLGRAAGERIVALPEVQIVGLDRRLGDLAARLAAEHRLRGADAVYVALAFGLGVPLFTWDAEQLARATGLVELV
jgi:predicted nucleic acid-binding protein